MTFVSDGSNSCIIILSMHHASNHSTITSKINVTFKDVYLPLSKLHSILTVANLLAHNNMGQISYWGKISVQSAAVNYSFSDNLTPLGVTFIFLAMVPTRSTIYRCSSVTIDIVILNIESPTNNKLYF